MPCLVGGSVLIGVDANVVRRLAVGAGTVCRVPARSRSQRRIVASLAISLKYSGKYGEEEEKAKKATVFVFVPRSSDKGRLHHLEVIRTSSCSLEMEILTANFS